EPAHKHTRRLDGPRAFARQRGQRRLGPMHTARHQDAAAREDDVLAVAPHELHLRAVRCLRFAEQFPRFHSPTGYSTDRGSPRAHEALGPGQPPLGPFHEIESSSLATSPTGVLAPETERW